MTENEIGKEVVDASAKIHSVLGPGLLESVYEVVLAKELERRGLAVERQVRFRLTLRKKILASLRLCVSLNRMANKTVISNPSYTAVVSSPILFDTRNGRT